MSVVLLYPSLALGAKRLHDRAKPTAWLLVFVALPMLASSLGRFVDGRIGDDSLMAGYLDLIGFGLSLWGLVELGCLRGTIGPNRHGPDPLVVPAVSGV